MDAVFYFVSFRLQFKIMITYVWVRFPVAIAFKTLCFVFHDLSFFRLNVSVCASVSGCANVYVRASVSVRASVVVRAK